MVCFVGWYGGCVSVVVFFVVGCGCFWWVKIGVGG